MLHSGYLKVLPSNSIWVKLLNSSLFKAQVPVAFLVKPFPTPRNRKPVFHEYWNYWSTYIITHFVLKTLRTENKLYSSLFHPVVS
jgi:hypothetical protein